MTIHREGRALLFFLLVILFAIGAAVYVFLPEAESLQQFTVGLSLVIYLLVLQFFRSPDVRISENAAHVLAPADGKVVVIEEALEEECFKEPRIQVSIFMSPLNVHVNRAPVGGRVTYFRYHPGKYRVAWHPKSSEENERSTFVVTTTQGTGILFRQIAGALARRICCYVGEGGEIRQGAEFGFIKFGSRVDVFIPRSSAVLVKVGESVRAGQTVLAELK